MALSTLVSPLLNYAADKLGLDRELFVPVFQGLEAAVTGNEAGAMLAALGFGANVAKKVVSYLQLGERMNASLESAGLDPNAVKAQVVDYVASQFTKRYAHMGDVLKKRSTLHKTRLQRAAKAGKITTSLSKKVTPPLRPMKK